MKKWNRIVVQDDPGYAEILGERVFQGLSVAMCDEDVERTRQGYKCINCWEDLDSAFPEACPVCSFPMKAEQAQRFAVIYRGWQPTFTGPDWEAEADRLEEQKERRAFEKRAAESGIALGGRGIIIPRSI